MLTAVRNAVARTGRGGILRMRGIVAASAPCCAGGIPAPDDVVDLGTWEPWQLDHQQQQQKKKQARGLQLQVPVEGRRVRLAAVPEQVNMPLSMAARDLERSAEAVAQQGGSELVAPPVLLDLHWTPEGTGRMVDAVERGEVDFALPVTDGAVAAIAAGRNVALLGSYVQSPLTWAVNTAPESVLGSLGALRAQAASAVNAGLETGLRVGVSRMGSGSHTMAHYMARRLGIPADVLHFRVCDDIDGLVGAVQAGSVDCFLWERFTSKCMQDNGTLQYAGEVAGPWPAFSFIARPDIAPDVLHAARSVLLPVIFRQAHAFKASEAASVERIVRDFQHTEADARAWLDSTEYASERDLLDDRDEVVNTVARVLMQSGAITPQQVHALLHHLQSERERARERELARFLTI